MNREIRYTLNDSDEIVAVNDDWDAFATANGAPHLAAGQVLGRSLWEFVTDDTTRLLYRDVLARVRRDRAIRFTFRCDAPDCRRQLEMEVSGAPDGGTTFRVRTLAEETRPPQPLLDPAHPRSAQLLRACGWCKKVDLDGRWVEVEEAVEAMGLFQHAELPQVTHGICDDCFARMSAAIEEAATAN